MYKIKLNKPVNISFSFGGDVLRIYRDFSKSKFVKQINGSCFRLSIKTNSDLLLEYDEFISDFFNDSIIPKLKEDGYV